MAKKHPKEIVQENLPDMEIVEGPRKAKADAKARAAKPGASMADLRRKYLGRDAADAAPTAGRGNADEEAGDIEVKQVRAKKSPADPADDPGHRTVIFSKNKGILGSQG